MADLEDLDYADESGEEEEDEQEDEFEQMLGMNTKQNIWKDNLSQKNEVVRELIKCFGSMVESRNKDYAVPDHRGKVKMEDKIFEKLLDAPKFVTRAKRALITNENFDNRHFSIFIAHKGWIKNILRPLLELCAKDDAMLAMRCCSLALVLIRRISDSSQKILTDATKGTKRKASSLDLQQNEDAKDEDDIEQQEQKNGKAGENGGKLSAADSDDKKKEKEREALQLRIDNVKEQIKALLSFKEALCSDKCNEAITNAFKQYWLKEQVATTEDNKTGVAICFSYLRRILAIDSNPHWSSVGEIQLHRTVHDKYIVQLRILLSVIPGVCSDLLNSYHNDWLGDIILIIYFTLRGFEPKDLHRVWRTGAIIADFETLDNYDETSATTGLSLAEVVVPTALATSVKNSSAVGKGRLAQALQRERNNSLAATANLSGGSGVNRFRGVYTKSIAGSVVLPSVQTSTVSNSTANHASGASISALDAILGPSTATNNTDTDAAPSTVPTVYLQTSKIIKDPFSTNANTVTTVQAKRNKKNLTFNVDDTIAEVSSQHYTTSTTHQRAAVVAASLANLLSNELSLKPLVKRVNDDLRRDDMRVGQELELRYFDILYRVLHYNRLKLGDEYREYQNKLAKVKGGAESKTLLWEPNLKNVMDALDRMSFMRVVTSIERLGKNPLHTDDIVTPMALFKEMVCYLRLLLESDLVGHHEIAVAALYRLYYASSERLDPLPKLLSAWKSGTYPKRHLHVLVELVHETLKTLDTAQVRFKPESAEDAKKATRKKNKSEMDMEQYTMSCMRFNVDDYFKRFIVTNHTVRMYTKLLSHYAKNESTINYYVYTYLRRLNMYVMEQEHRAPMPVSVSNTSNSVSTTGGSNGSNAEEEQVSLSFMLFNIHTLEVFSTILNDTTIHTNTVFEPLLRLIKSIVRRFGSAATKNRMLFVELLFVHPRPHDFCVSLDSVYEASAYATFGNSKHRHHTSGSGGVDGTANADDASSSDSSSGEDTDYGDEFDENNLNPAFAADPKLAKKTTAGTKSKDKKKRSRRQLSLSDESDDDNNNHNKSDSDIASLSGGEGAAAGGGSGEKEGGAGNAGDSSSAKKSKKDKSERKRDRENRVAAPAHAQAGPQRTSSRTSSRGWTAEEDAVLKEQYALYAGSHSVFTSIAQCPELRALGSHRNEAQVAKRVTQLRLHMHIDFSESEGEGEAEGETQEQRASQAPRPSANHHYHSHHSEDFIMFSDHDEEEDEGEGSDMEVETQAQHQQGSPNYQADDAAELAGLFSPLPNTTKNSSGSTGAGINTSGGGAAKGKAAGTGSSHKKARYGDEVDSATLPRAVWDLDDGPDLLEQRSLALMKSTGNAGYNLSDDDDSLFGATTNKKKTSTTTNSTSNSTTVKKGLTKSMVHKPTVVESDDESLEFEDTTTNTNSNTTNTSSGANEATNSGAASISASAMYKKRLMRIDSDDEE